MAGDVVMLEHELTPVLKALRASGIDIVAIHHHMTSVQPMVVFLHYYGKGEAATLARAVRAALDQTGKRADGQTLDDISGDNRLRPIERGCVK